MLCQPLTPRRSKIAMLAGAAAALGGSLNLMHHPHGSDLRYSVIGLVVGVVVGVSILLVARNRRKCQDNSAFQK
jgi:peptidoglycan/LPS O-acetylase OafA/YrhL